MSQQSDDARVRLDHALAALESNAADWGPEVFKAVVSGLPIVGSLAGFALDQLPARRIDRVITYLRIFARHVEGLEGELRDLQRDWQDRPEASGLFDAGLRAAAEATSEARLERLAKVVISGLTGNEVIAMNAARRLRLLRDIDDGEFAVLAIVERDRRITLRYDPNYTWVDDDTISFLSAEGAGQSATLPTELVGWPLPDLSTALNHLAGLGLIEANTAQHSQQTGAVRSYAATPAGQELVRIVLNN